MKVIKYGEHNIAFGLQWMRLPGERVSAEIVAALEERNASLGLVRKISDEYDLRQQIGMCEEKSAKGSYAASALIAESEDSLIFIDKISDEDYWICAISDKEVLPGGDQVGNEDAIKEKLDDLLVEFGPESDDLKIVVSSIASEELEIEGDDTYSFEDFIFKNEERLTKDAKIGSVKTFPKPALYLLGVILLGGGAYIGLNPDNEKVAALSYVLPGDTPFQAIERVNLPLGPSEDDILAAALMEEIKWLREDFEIFNPNTVISSVLNVVETIPRHTGGWESGMVTFDATKRRDSVSVSWKRGVIGSTNTLLDELDIVNHRFMDDGETAFTIHQVEKLKKRRVGRDILQYISRSDYEISNLMEDLQILNINWTVAAPSITVRPVPIEGIKSKSLSTKRQLNQRYKEFKVSDTSRLSLESLSNLLSQADTVLIKKVKIDINNYSWTVIGEIYEK